MHSRVTTVLQSRRGNASCAGIGPQPFVFPGEGRQSHTHPATQDRLERECCVRSQGITEVVRAAANNRYLGSMRSTGATRLTLSLMAGSCRQGAAASGGAANQDSFTRLVTLGADLEEQAGARRSVVPRLGVKGSQVQILSSRRSESAR
jgi:hypothetical protein